MRKYKKLLIFSAVVLVLVVIFKMYEYVYPVAYERGKTDPFYCKLTNGFWVEETSSEQLGKIDFVMERGCHENTDTPFLRK